MQTQEQWLTKRQAAEMLSISEVTVHRYTSSGKLKSHKVGKRLVRISLSDLHAFMSQMSLEGATS